VRTFVAGIDVVVAVVPLANVVGMGLREGGSLDASGTSATFVVAA
jgi:hypothetical protein